MRGFEVPAHALFSGPGYSGFQSTLVPSLCWGLYKAVISGLPPHRFRFACIFTSQ